MALEEPEEAGAVARFVFGDFMNRVVDRVVTKFFRADGDIEPCRACNLFRLGALNEVRHRILIEEIANEFREFSGVFRFLERVALKRWRLLDSLALSLTTHREVHSNFGAFGGEEGVETLKNFWSSTWPSRSW